MTADEALTYSESFDPTTIDRGGSIQEAFLELAAEVRRLRAEREVVREAWATISRLDSGCKSYRTLEQVLVGEVAS